jgi:pyruvate dehydrogenase E2 component (dihydrolipoamide acetyltransferase)
MERENTGRSIVDRLIYSVLLIKAVAKAVHDVPEMNGFWRDGAFVPGAGVHPGIAISLRGGAAWWRPPCATRTGSRWAT